MVSPTSEGLDNAVSTPDAKVTAPTPENETTKAWITGDQPENSPKRQSGAGKEEQEVGNKYGLWRQKLCGQMINWHKEARAAANLRNDERLAHAIENGRLECVQLCEKLRTTLPRELRDLVYRGIIGPHNRESVKRDTKETSKALVGPGLKLLNHDLCRLQPPDSTGLHWWLDSYTGEKVSIEIVERWYSTRTFCFNVGKLDLIPTFLGHDIFSKGLEPGLIIQRIHAHVYGPPIELDRSLDPQILNLCLFDNLTSILSQIKNRNVKLYIRIRSYFTIEALRLALERLGPVVYQLRKEGFSRIKVQRTTGNLDYTFLFNGQETLFKDRLDKWALTASPKA